MLHDIGKTILDNYLPEEYAQVIELCNNDGVHIYEAERSILGISHAELGGKVGDRWQLPDVLCESIRWHHDAAAAGEEFARNAALVCLADYVARVVGIGQTGDAWEPSVDGGAMQIWGSSPDQLNKAIEELEGYRERIEQFQS